METKNAPLYCKTDILVCGGGTAGTFAAIAAAEQGKNVLLVEQFGSLGGTPTNGLTTPLMGTHIQEEPHCSYITEKLNEKMIRYGGMDAETKRMFDPVILKIVLEEMCEEAGVTVLLHTFVADVVREGPKVSAVVIANKKGLQRIEADYYIDATGDGDVCVFAGAEYRKGNPEMGGKNQPISLRYIIGNIDIQALSKFTKEEMDRTGIHLGAVLSDWRTGKETYYASVTAAADCTFTEIFKKAIANGHLTEDDLAYWQVFSIPGRNDSLAYNNPEFFDCVDGTDPRHLTFTQIQGRKRIMRHLAFYKKYMKGFDNAYISDIAAQVGVRESRNITAEYVITGEDLIAKRKFKDHFSQSNYPVDIHGRQLDFKEREGYIDDGKPWYEVPYRSLVVKGIDNLFVCGRCLGAEFLAEAALRIQITMRSSGEAAGIAAAMAMDLKILPREINGIDVRNTMKEKGAVFLD